MKIYPAIDLIEGQVVRLTKGDFNQKTIYDNDPLSTAMRFQRWGSQYLHIVDLDGAKKGSPQQTPIIKKIASETSLKIQVGGGIRSPDHVQELIEAGIDRVIIGSLAVKDSATTKQIFETFSGERITLGLDIFIENDIPMVATHGWQSLSQTNAFSLLEQYIPMGLSQVLCTDISRDGTLTEPNFQLYKTLSEAFPSISILASGGLSSLDQIHTLREIPISGAIIGKGIYENTLDLSEIFKC